jgi:FkbM family methyltransferase
VTNQNSSAIHDQVLQELSARMDVVTTTTIRDVPIQFLTNASFPYTRVANLLLDEPETVFWLDSAPQEGQLWDIGANMGIFTLYAAMLRDMHVTAFEPESGNFSLLNKNIALNKIDERVVAYCVGLSDTSGFSKLYRYLSFESAGINSVGQEIDAHLQPRKSLCQQGAIIFTGDELLRYHRLPAPDYVKIDVDGIEHQIINGMPHVLQHCQSILVELNQEIAEHRAAIAVLTNHGFHFHEELTRLTTIEQGHWKGLVNLIFHRDHGVLEQIYQKFNHALTTDLDIKLHRDHFANGKTYLNASAQLNARRVQHI